jgi:RnfABCDGE-type electron transport complex B subunit
MIFLAIFSVTVIGVVCALLLSTASKVMAVDTDERIERLLNCMPGSNCGACGYPGCEAYAEALSKGEAASNLCTPGGADVAKRLSEILGVEAGEVEAKLAVVHCRGDCNVHHKKMEYHGIQTCAAAKLVYGGEGSCPYGCLGYGDCLPVCPYMDHGLAWVNTDRCCGCGLCVSACPKKMIAVEFTSETTAVKCKNTEKGAKLKDKCSVGCIGCTKCVKACHAEAISMNESLAVLDNSKCDGCAALSPQPNVDAVGSKYKCAEVCIKGCIVITD